jgi:hypothetical protein
MNKHNVLLTAAFAAAMLAASSAGAQNTGSGVSDSANRGVGTPSSVENTPTYNQGIPSGQPAIPSVDNPMNPNESKPFVQQPEGVRPLVRGDNPNLPNPTTPQSANETAAQPTLRDQTNTTGMEGRRSGVGATR